jgi:hypothetical protein
MSPFRSFISHPDNDGNLSCCLTHVNAMSCCTGGSARAERCCSQKGRALLTVEGVLHPVLVSSHFESTTPRRVRMFCRRSSLSRSLSLIGAQTVDLSHWHTNRCFRLSTALLDCVFLQQRRAGRSGGSHNSNGVFAPFF